MKKIYGFCMACVVTAVLLAGLFLLGVLGIETTLLTKLFIVFVGVVIGFQSVPAIKMFSGMIREVVIGKDAVVEKSTR